MSPRSRERSLAALLRAAREEHELSLRDVEREIGVRSGHLSQIETGAIVKPELSLLWELAALYGLDFAELAELAHHKARDSSTRDRHRMTVALRAMRELTPAEQTEALRYMADLKSRRQGD
jgi:transcriptional regulator with XRE-family HTH domain